ncbi:MAG: recombinase family protein, partial [Methylococcaceae bacterium]
YLDRVFTDTASGKTTNNRPELERCLFHLRAGDVLHVHSIDRLARNLKELQTIVDDVTQEGVAVRFHKENLLFDMSNDNPMQTLMFQMLGAFAEFERTLARERQREGIAAAKARGQKLGAPPKLKPSQVKILRDRVALGEDKAKVAKAFGISRPTLYKLIACP